MKTCICPDLRYSSTNFCSRTMSCKRWQEYVSDEIEKLLDAFMSYNRALAQKMFAQGKLRVMSLKKIWKCSKCHYMSFLGPHKHDSRLVHWCQYCGAGFRSKYGKRAHRKNGRCVIDHYHGFYVRLEELREETICS